MSQTIMDYWWLILFGASRMLDWSSQWCEGLTNRLWLMHHQTHGFRFV